MPEKLITETDERMVKTGESLARELSGIRTGKANPALLDPVKVDYYGTPTSLRQLANVGVPEPRLILIQPFDKTVLGEIEKAIQKSSLGLNPSSDGNVIRIPIPTLTEDRRKELGKVVKKMGENAKVAVRNIRRDTNEKLKKMEKASEISEDDSKRLHDRVQEMTDKHIKEIDGMVTHKEKEVMEV